MQNEINCIKGGVVMKKATLKKNTTILKSIISGVLVSIVLVVGLSGVLGLFIAKDFVKMSSASKLVMFIQFQGALIGGVFACNASKKKYLFVIVSVFTLYCVVLVAVSFILSTEGLAKVGQGILACACGTIIALAISLIKGNRTLIRKRK